MSARKKNLFDPISAEPFPLSRSKIDLFMECPRCFYLDRRLGIGRPGGPAFTLNVAVDYLLKREFDAYRRSRTAHPLMEQYKVDAIPFDDPLLEQWRNNFKGIQYLHPGTKFIIFGAIDDVWIKPDGSLIIVDYKATSTQEEISLDDEYKQCFKRQMDVYQWLFRMNGHKVDDVGYFVYANALKNRDVFEKKLEFDTMLIPYKGDDSWVEGAIVEARKCLDSDKMPAPTEDCEFCAYRNEAGKV